MKFLIKLLKDWKASDGKTYASGITIEVDKAVAAELIMDGTGEKVDKAVEGDDSERLEKAIDKAMDRQIDKIVDKTSEKIHSIQAKDLSDEDPFHGFLAGYNGGTVTKEAKQFAFGNFCRELEKAGERFVGASPLLKKSLERSKNMVTKAAGTGLMIQQDDSAGALVPPELNNMLMTMSDETAVLEPRCAKLSIGTNRIELPHPIDYDRSSGLVHGGVVAYFQGENGALTESRPKMEDIGINLH